MLLIDDEKYISGVDCTCVSLLSKTVWLNKIIVIFLPV